MESKQIEHWNSRLIFFLLFPNKNKKIFKTLSPGTDSWIQLKSQKHVFLYFQRFPILLLLLQLFALSNALKFLYLVPFPAPSHWFWLKNFSEELLKRGHHVSHFLYTGYLLAKRNKNNHFCSINPMFQVTVITNFKRAAPHANYTEIIIDPPYNIPKYCKSHDQIRDSPYIVYNVHLVLSH